MAQKRTPVVVNNASSYTGTRTSEHFIFEKVEGEIDGGGGHDKFDIGTAGRVIGGAGNDEYNIKNVGTVEDNGGKNTFNIGRLISSLTSKGSDAISIRESSVEITSYGNNTKVTVQTVQSGKVTMNGVNAAVDIGSLLQKRSDESATIIMQENGTINVQNQNTSINAKNDSKNTISVKNAGRTHIYIGNKDTVTTINVDSVDIKSSWGDGVPFSYADGTAELNVATAKNRVSVDFRDPNSQGELKMKLRIDGLTGEIIVLGSQQTVWQKDTYNDTVILGNNFRLSTRVDGQKTNPRRINLGLGGNDQLVIENPSNFLRILRAADPFGEPKNARTGEALYILQTKDGGEIELAGIEKIVFKNSVGNDVTLTPDQTIGKSIDNIVNHK